MYNLCGGERLAQYVRSVHRSLFADLTPEQVLELTYDVQQYHDEPLDKLAAAGLPRGLRAARDQRARSAGAGPKMKIWPGIDIDIPTARDQQEDAAGRRLSAR